MAKYKDRTEFTEAEMEAAFADICGYDMVITSYQSNPTMYTLLRVAERKAGTQYVMDVDDNMFAINPDNPVWAAVSDENVYHMQCMIRDNTWITTTTPELAAEFRKRRPGHHKNSVLVSPNYIDDEYQHPAFDNGKRLVIGFVGGSSHYGDMHRTGVLEAIQKLMHEYKHVYFKSVGMVVDTYLPKARVTLGEPRKGDAYLQEVFPNLNYDISIGPLEDNIFNRGKSNIKWQESTRAGAVFVCSNVGPYAKLPRSVACRVENNAKDWYEQLKLLVESQDMRLHMLANARRVLEKNWRLETHGDEYAAMLERVHSVGQANHKKEVTI